MATTTEKSFKVFYWSSLIKSVKFFKHKNKRNEKKKNGKLWKNSNGKKSASRSLRSGHAQKEKEKIFGWSASTIFVYWSF